MGADLESGGVPTGVLVGGPGEVTELDLETGVVGVHVHRERDLQHCFIFPPVNICFEIDAVNIIIKDDVLREER